ncbi:MAG: sugar transferase [Verrucomicrobia bacterium]|nr:sugar transferase [Verrucomicrobiota bacterium]
MTLNELSSETALPASFQLEIDEQIIVHNALKRGFDILFSMTALVLGLPVFAVIALLVKLSSPGPVFYCSLRIGRKGRLFKFWKFRSMHRDADQRLEVMLSSNPALKKEWQKYFKLKNDPRLTRIGSFLRKTSLDELPQFWNVLIGDLSIVGPRPYLPREADVIRKILGQQMEKMFSMRPGLTGIWQTSGRSFLTFEERVKLEVDYVDKRSFLFDLNLIAKTIPTLVFRKGAF